MTDILQHGNKLNILWLSPRLHHKLEESVAQEAK